MQPVFRFAPSPNGFLHLGHAYSALLNGDLARRSGGRLLLRIEDIDPARSRAAFDAAILEDLAWLGLSFEPSPRRQSAHLHEYRAAGDRLAQAGLLYPCFCSRTLIAAAPAAPGAKGRDPDGAPLYPGTCKALSLRQREARLAHEPHAWRLDMAAALRLCAAKSGGPLSWRAFDPDSFTPKIHDRDSCHQDSCDQDSCGQDFCDPLSPRSRSSAFDILGAHGEARAIAAMPQAWGDVVIMRKDVPTSYHLAVVHDDALQGVTHIVRGSDLAEATAVHRLLQIVLGLPSPLYHHHHLLRDESGAKLAKRRGAPALRDLRAQGASPADIRRLAGLPPAALT
jgi:glutamyl-Q tRNA(Asp) synthetase